MMLAGSFDGSKAAFDISNEKKKAKSSWKALPQIKEKMIEVSFKGGCATRNAFSRRRCGMNT